MAKQDKNDIWTDKKDRIRKILVVALIVLLLVFLIVVISLRSGDLKELGARNLSSEENTGSAARLASSSGMNSSEPLDAATCEVRNDRLEYRLSDAERFLKGAQDELDEVEKELQRAQAKVKQGESEIASLSQEIKGLVQRALLHQHPQQDHKTSIFY